MRYSIVYLDINQDACRAMLAHIHEALCQDQLLERVFYDGTNRTVDEFMDDMSRPGTLPFVVMAENEPAAFIWLNSIEGRAARGHFVFFRRFWGRRRTAAIGKHYFRYILSRKDIDGYLLDSLVGITPKSNALSWKYGQECGCTMVGILPQFVWMAEKGVSEDAMVFAVTRENMDVHEGENVEGVWDE